MNTQPILAIVWKEYRQVRSVLIGLFLLILFIAYLASTYGSRSNYYLKEQQDLFIGLHLFPIIPCLAFFLGAGIRIIENSIHLKSYLHLRPIHRSTLFFSYFIVGMIGWFVWLFLCFSVQVGFFGFDILNPIIDVATKNQITENPFKFYYIFTLLYTFIYTLTFSVCMLYPGFILSCGTCFGGYLFLVYHLSNYWNLKLYFIEQEFPFVLFTILIILSISILLFLTYRLYHRIQMG